jgi:hypothetical protein
MQTVVSSSGVALLLAVVVIAPRTDKRQANDSMRDFENIRTPGLCGIGYVKSRRFVNSFVSGAHGQMHGSHAWYLTKAFVTWTDVWTLGEQKKVGVI